ncbi:MAG TPA: MFS transporter, partial [Planctomycetaceae bacterium]|nr:MFS transporter [Planctomycetaceae bacterium]
AGPGWVRGCLPVLNRLGQSVPPVFAAAALKALRYKKWALAGCTVLMGVPFAVLAVVWLTVGHELQASRAKASWLAWLFLGLYFLFFVLYGLYLVSFGTVQGKLIRPTRRGHLLLVSTFWGALPATLVAVWLMPGWLQEHVSAWERVFACVAVCFFASGVIAQLLAEPGDRGAAGTEPKAGSLRDTFGALSRDANLRQLVLVVMLFASGLIIFPHYQALARQRLGLSGVHLVAWVVTQNVAVAAYSLIVGPLADRRGNRLTMRLLIFASAIPPAFATALPYLPGGAGKHLFWLVYVPLGVTPLVLRTVSNYALEICPPERHPRYLSTVSLGLAVPFLFSPLVGWLVDAVDFEVVFLSAVVLVCLSGWLTFRLDEPRYRLEEVRGESIARGTEG